MNTTFLSIATSLLLFLTLPSASVSFRSNQEDYKVLLKIKAALGNPYALASWVEGTECCYWCCLDCDRKTNRVNELTVFTCNISGQIPPAVGDLPYLEKLVFRKLTNFTGGIPEAITKLTYLKRLTLGWNNLSGPVPSFLGKLTNLTSIDLSFNDLTGSIPPSLSKLSNLYDLDLSRNKLTGTIPTSFGKFSPATQYIILSHNQLSGSLPKSMGNLNVTRLDFSRNQLSGDLSYIFGSDKSIQDADFSRNMFEFDLSKTVFSKDLRSLDLNHNKIYGSLPSTLGDVSNFNVSYNSYVARSRLGEVSIAWTRLLTFITSVYAALPCLLASKSRFWF